VDEDSQAAVLVALLVAAGYDVMTVSEAGLAAADDEVVLAFARSDGRVLLTRNARDFRALHDLDCNHAGILVVFRSKDSSKNMSYADIARAVGNIEASGLELAGQFVALNAWNY
jgi:predicted nuclease of predicted toxin-antitoxin system